MKGMFLGSLVLLVAGTSMGLDLAGQDVAVTVDATWVSKYIWRGFDVLDDSAAWQPSVDFALENGFGANLWMSYANGGGNTETGASRTDLNEYDYTLYYSNSIYEDVWQTDYTVGWVYYDYISQPSEASDMQEGFLSLSWPNLVGNGFVPHYNYYHMWASEENSGVGSASGCIHVLGFTYDWTCDQMPDMPLSLMWDIVYNCNAGGATDSDWSHMVWGVSTSFDCPYTGGSITPALYYQNSFERSVNEDDELWCGISYSYSF